MHRYRIREHNMHITYHNFANYLRRNCKRKQIIYSSGVDHEFENFKRKFYKRVASATIYRATKFIENRYDIKSILHDGNRCFVLKRDITLEFEVYNEPTSPVAIIWISIKTKKHKTKICDLIFDESIANMISILIGLYPNATIDLIESCNNNMVAIYSAKNQETKVTLQRDGKWSASTTITESGSIDNPQAQIFKKQKRIK